MDYALSTVILIRCKSQIRFYTTIQSRSAQRAHSVAAFLQDFLYFAAKYRHHTILK